MSLWLTVIIEFFKTGLFAVGGGLATIPFLQDMAYNLMITKKPGSVKSFMKNLTISGTLFILNKLRKKSVQGFQTEKKTGEHSLWERYLSFIQM